MEASWAAHRGHGTTRQRAECTRPPGPRSAGIAGKTSRFLAGAPLRPAEGHHVAPWIDVEGPHLPLRAFQLDGVHRAVHPGEGQQPLHRETLDVLVRVLLG